MLGRCVSAILIALSFVACAEQRQANVALQTNPNGIVGGEEVAEGDWKARTVAMIYGEKEDGQSYICTGTFIAPKTILTAAHCITSNLATMSVMFGAQPFKVLPQDLKIKSVKVHEGYKATAKTDRNDIALIFLAEDLPTGVSLASIGHDLAEKIPSALESYGYGRTEGREDSENFSEDLGTLRKVAIEGKFVTSFADDAKLLELDQSGGHGVCFGDSGGPLLSSKGQIIGVAAGVEPNPEDSSDSCAFKSFFTNVVSYRDWIITNLNNP
jgi:secreted trypsin-like serine protease